MGTRYGDLQSGRGPIGRYENHTQILEADSAQGMNEQIAKIDGHGVTVSDAIVFGDKLICTIRFSIIRR